jgi:hypothetical protein
MNAAPPSPFAAAIPEPFQILGLRLLPLSLGRYRLMHRFGVAFVSDGERGAGIDDLILGVLICSMPCRQFLAWSSSESFFRDVRKWSLSIYPKPWVGRIPFIGKWWKRKHGFNFVEKLQLFANYIKTGSVMPLYWDTSTGNGGRGGGHWANNIEVVLRSELNWTSEEIDELPLTKAFSDYLTYAEGQGQVQLMTPEEIEMIHPTK